jgi:hypothetical protein
VAAGRRLERHFTDQGAAEQTKDRFFLLEYSYA